jgi:type VI secretion system protein ImpG
VLERFLGLTASLNSFTQLNVTTPQRKEGLHRWEPRSGRRVLV